jgi:hypothetical protein
MVGILCFYLSASCVCVDVCLSCDLEFSAFNFVGDSFSCLRVLQFRRSDLLAVRGQCYLGTRFQMNISGAGDHLPFLFQVQIDYYSEETFRFDLISKYLFCYSSTSVIHNYKRKVCAGEWLASS